MEPADVPAVAALEGEVFSEPWSEKGFFDALKQEGTIFLVAESCTGQPSDGLSSDTDAPPSDQPSDGLSSDTDAMPSDQSIDGLSSDADAQPSEQGQEILGYCGLYVSGDEGEITNVAVVSSARLQGVAAALLRSLCQRSKAQGVQQIFLEVRQSNIPAKRLYESFDFRVIGQRKNFYRKPTEDAILMCLTIE